MNCSLSNVLTLDLLKHSEPTPADDNAPKSSLTVETSHGTTWIVCLYILPPDYGTLSSKLNSKFSSEKTDQLLFSQPR